MIYKYKGKEFDIRCCCDGDWDEHVGFFRVEQDQPYNFGYTKTYEEMKNRIKIIYDEYMEKIPKDESGWLCLFEECVIQDCYEDWHIDKQLAIRLLELYKSHGGEHGK